MTSGLIILAGLLAVLVFISIRQKVAFNPVFRRFAEQFAKLVPRMFAALIAAGFIAESLASDDPSRLQAYAQAIEEEYGDYHRVARTFVKVIGNPAVMRSLTKIGIRSRPLMEWTLKVMANLLEPEERGMSERVYYAIEKAVQAAPEPALYT